MPRGEKRPLGVDKVDPRVYQWPPRLGRLRHSLAVSFCMMGAALVLLLAGCSQRGSRETLAERASEYWKLRQAKRWEEVYDGYLDPSLKSTLSRDTFLKKRLLAFDILNYTISEATEQGDEGTVRVKAQANIPLRAPGAKVQMTQKEFADEEQWVRREGVWYVRLSE